MEPMDIIYWLATVLMGIASYLIRTVYMSFRTQLKELNELTAELGKLVTRLDTSSKDIEQDIRENKSRIDRLDEKVAANISAIAVLMERG